MSVRFNVADITRYRMDGDVMQVTAIARHPGVLNYWQADGTRRGELVSPFFLRKMDSDGLPIIRRIAGIPVTNEHPTFLLKYRPDSTDELATGKVGQKLHVFKDGATEVTFETWDSETQKGIRSGAKPGVSLGYEVATVPAHGNWDGVPYQFEQAEPFYADHLAVVGNPRARGAIITRFDAEDDWAYQEYGDSTTWDFERRKTLDSGDITGAFAGQELSFPIASIRDVTDAWISSFRTDSEETVRQNILAIAKEYGWQDGLPPEAIAWAQERAIPIRKTVTKRKDMSTVTMTFDGGITAEIPAIAAPQIAAIRTKSDGMEKDFAALQAKYDALQAKHDELHADAKKKEKDKEEMEEEMGALMDSLTFEKSRADGLEAEKAKAPNLDADQISGEVTNRIDAYLDAIAILSPETRESLDSLEINFDGKQSVLEIQKAVIKHLSPDLKLDSDAEVPGAYKIAKMYAKEAPRNTQRSDAFSIVREQARSTQVVSAKERRLQRMDEQQRRSRLSFAQQQEFDRKNA